MDDRELIVILMWDAHLITSMAELIGLSTGVQARFALRPSRQSQGRGGAKSFLEPGGPCF